MAARTTETDSKLTQHPCSSRACGGVSHGGKPARMRSLWLAAAWFAAFAMLCTSATYAARAWLRSRAAPGPEEERLGALVAARAFLVECGALATNLLALPFGWLLRHRPTKS